MRYKIRISAVFKFEASVFVSVVLILSQYLLNWMLFERVYLFNFVENSWFSTRFSVENLILLQILCFKHVFLFRNCFLFNKNLQKIGL